MNAYLVLAGIFVSSALVVWGLCFPLRRWLLRRQLLDQPNQRSNHTAPTPRGGGVAISLTILAGLLALGMLGERSSGLLLLAGCAAFVSFISFLDDVWSLSAASRFIAQLAATAMFLYPVMHRSGALTVSDGLWFGTAFLLVIGYTNSFNFMDGINGIAGMQALITGLGTTTLILMENPGLNPLAAAPIVVAGAATGFLPHNFPKARMFMGDVGSATLGFVFGALIVLTGRSFGAHAFIAMLMLHTNFIVDTAITFIRRLLRGEKVYEAHREHFYQRLVRAGRSHLFVTGTEAVLQIVTLAIALMFLKAESRSLQVALAAIVVLVWGSFFLFAEYSYQSSQQPSSDRGRRENAESGARIA